MQTKTNRQKEYWPKTKQSKKSKNNNKNVASTNVFPLENPKTCFDVGFRFFSQNAV